ncbi:MULTISPECIES: extracellular solute-binding protein [unclassified Chelatococcus]|uniref:ABC transporter substrate-binding protein n=1 Tax=unclassified Chelatococcus TaxID=2638111 RepID=UPI001BCB536D|nr:MULTISPECIES: extracellular solute-binding protein [unclassified Chelatococcus]MBS7701120.1 extracellular solute-binding protein [Chelatococcus sp. YT9]MBX3557251.1 extracellular solute-binding protein [Chelatococcus sp.]
MRGIVRLIIAGAAGGVVLSAGASAQDIMIWHDKGEDGLRMIEQMSELYKKEHPNVTIKSLSMPTDQWFSRTIAALNTNTAPDIIFNDNPRIVQIQQTTRKLSDLKPQLDQLSADDRKAISPADVAASTYQDRVLQIPFQRTMTGLGVRKSWLAKVGEPYPQTWDDVLRVAKKFQDDDPDGNGRKDTFGIAMQAGDPASMINGGISLLVYGNSLPHPFVNDKGDVIIDQPEVAKATIEYLKLFTDYKLVSPETVNHTFTDMYQLIEGGRVGMFRVGNWNVGKWDKSPPAGDYIVGGYPTFGPGPGAMVVGSVRGMAVPENAKNKEAAKEFVKFIVSKGAQQISLNNMGGSVRGDLDTSSLTPGLKPFVESNKLQMDDFAAAKFPWYLKLQEAYYKHLINAVNNPPADWNTWIKTTADVLRKEQANLQKKG